MNKEIYFSPPHIGKYEQQLAAETFASNWIAPLGPQVDAFEREVAEYVGMNGALALSSGTAAIHLALRYLGVGAGDIVFASSLTFIGSVNPILYQGATPVLIDSEPQSWNIAGNLYYPHEPGRSISDQLFEQGICLPSGTSMTVEDQERIIGWIGKTMIQDQ